MTNELPAIGSVWGVPGDSSTWMRVNSVDGLATTYSVFVGEKAISTHNFPPSSYVRLDDAANAVWDEVVEALQSAWPSETLVWDESPRELITRLVNERDELRGMRDITRTDTAGRDVTNLPGLWSEDDTIGNRLPELTDAARERMNAMPSDIVKRLWDALETSAGTIVGFEDHKAAFTSLTFLFANSGKIEVSLNGRVVPGGKPITTCGDVLKWLDVLGIEVKKGGES